jgi:hypothetical protein
MLKSPLRFIVALAALAVALPASAQNQKRSVVADLVSDMETAEQKVVGLAEAIPESKYGWRPGEGVRSIAEVVMHSATSVPAWAISIRSFSMGTG